MGSYLASKRIFRVLRKKKPNSSPAVLISSAGSNLNKSHSHRHLTASKLILGISDRKPNKRILCSNSKTLTISREIPNKLQFKQKSMLSKLKIHKTNN